MSGARPGHASPDRWTALVLRAGDLRAAFLPGMGMLCSSLTHRGEELLRRQRDLRAMAAKGSTAGIPLLHPWANRLASSEFEVAGQRVALDRASPLLHWDGHGLPIHGVPWSCLMWQVQESSARSLLAYLEWTSPELLAVFPFAHRVVMAVSLDETALIVRTTLRALGDQAVPVSFGYHPYLGLPSLARGAWRIELPAMARLELDARGIPTGRREPVPAWSGTLEERSWDDAFELPGSGARMALVGAGRRIEVQWLEGYRFAQVFAPAGDECVAFEPMMAEANALVSGAGLPLARPGSTVVAAFAVAVSDASSEPSASLGRHSTNPSIA